jgi:hypothetical protein
MDVMRFGTGNVWISCRSLSLKPVARELDLMAVKGVKWDKGGIEPADDYTFFYGNENTNHLGTDFFMRNVIMSVLKRTEFISDRMYSYNSKRSLVWYYSECACTN